MSRTSAGSTGWLLLVISTAGAPAATRVHVWRRLKELGALGMHPGVSLLPNVAAAQRAAARLAARVSADGGQARITAITFTEQREHDAAVAELVAAREIEYREVLERLPELFAELESETARGRITFAEVEESEADLERFRRWVAKIVGRDYFGAPSRPLVESELERATVALARFENLALTVDGDTAPQQSTPDTAAPDAARVELRIVDAPGEPARPIGGGMRGSKGPR